MSKPRVMFIHGLEGHPEGTKVKLLRAQGFEVYAADMHMSVWQLGRKNSVVRNLLRSNALRGAGLGVLLGIGASLHWMSPWPALAALLIAGGVFAQRRKALVVTAIQRSFDRCVEIQSEAVTRWTPEIIVGSSWGGAVCADMLLSGVWSGPTILLAPAVRGVSQRTQRCDPSEALTQLERGARPILVFHDPKDEVVPHADSVALAHGEGIELRSVDAGGHRLIALLERGELAEAIHACIAAPDLNS